MGQEFLPSEASGVEDLRRRHPGRRGLVAVALTLGLGATAACSGTSGTPVAPSPGLTGSVSVSPAEGVPVSPGPGVTKPGIRLTAVPRNDGSFDITEDVMLPEATDIVQLQLPDSGEHLPGMMARTEPRATNLQVVADGEQVPIEQTSLAAPMDLPLTVAATKLQLSYRLSGSFVQRTPSVSRRAGAAIRPLTAGADGTLPTNLTVTQGLLNAVCPLLTETRCAVGDPPTLGILPGIPANKALVVLQLDLPN
ncbi:hypothetical protein ACIBG5_09875 [Kribbella sp. NPDC050241]|uniref:hypothetical protein n=1 Tax=Kribbella sp. NPDC050241 TaxID=3364115 RepID=UPI003792CD54